jgi:hypothetical protein
MNIKFITKLGLVAMTMAMTSLAPALANNNNKALNQLAMQYYAQNQAAAGNPVFGGAYNPLIGNASYNPTQAALASGYNNPWAGNAAYSNNYGLNAYGNGNNNGGGCHHHHGNGNSFGNGFNSGNLGFNNNYNNNAYGNIVAPQYSNLAGQAAQIQQQLAYGNLPSWQANSLQNKLLKIQRKESGLASGGYGSPYVNGNGGFLNNIRGSLGI